MPVLRVWHSLSLPLHPARLPVVDDYGKVGTGASEAHYVLAENGTEYIIKGPGLCPGHPTVGGNEWVAARLASLLGLPLLDYQIVVMGGDVFFASSWMEKPTFYPAISADLFKRCENRNRAYDLVVFDAWLVNPDRHGENLIVRHIAKAADKHLLVLNDHSHLLASPSGPSAVAGLMGHLDSPPGRYVRLDFIRDSITDASLLSQGLDRVEAIPDADIQEIVASTPVELLPVADQGVYANFLVQRKSKLRSLFQQHQADFPNLAGQL